MNPISAYVRLGASDEERVLSFKRLDDIPDSEWLKRGLAIDGNSIRVDIGPRDVS